MPTLTWFDSSAVPRQELGPLLTDYLTLDRLREIRRLLLVRCGGLALIAAVVGPFINGFTALARLVTVVMFLLPPLCAWVIERRADRRLAHRLRSVDARNIDRPRAAAK